MHPPGIVGVAVVTTGSVKLPKPATLAFWKQSTFMTRRCTSSRAKPPRLGSASSALKTPRCVAANGRLSAR